MPKNSFWTNPSVLALAGEHDPVQEITRRVRKLVERAFDEGWSGPPFDPLALADVLGIRIRSTDDVPEARLTYEKGQPSIEYNPNRPRARMRYSIAHEIAHTIFPDYADKVRHRIGPGDATSDDWQLESLCNLAAAEILMPAAQLSEANNKMLSIESLMELRKQFEVSAEALLRRVVRMQESSCAMFCASRPAGSADYHIEYIAPSLGWQHAVLAGTRLPSCTVVKECVAIGYTAKGSESWFGDGNLRIECVGVPGYPGTGLPRVVGFMANDADHNNSVSLQFLTGSVLEPRGEGARIIVHIVNDKTASWGGGGIAVRIREKWPHVQESFREWARENDLKLGSAHIDFADDDIMIASVVAQRGYGPSSQPRLRYEAVRCGLQAVAEAARKRNASVHMPRIGTGQAGGLWEIVEETVRDTLCDLGISVTVYDLPGASIPRSNIGRTDHLPKQLSLPS